MYTRAQKNGVNLVGVDGRGWELCQVVFVDDTALVADSKDNMQMLVEEFGRIFERRKLKVNVNNSEMMHCSRQVDGGRLNMSLNGEMLEEVDHFKYLGSRIGREGGVGARFRVGEAKRAAGIVRKLWRNGGLGVEARKMLYKGVVVPTALYGAEMRGLRGVERRKLNVVLNGVSEEYVWTDIVEYIRK